MMTISPISSERTSALSAIWVTFFVLILFSVSLVSREIRLAAALLCVAVAIGSPTILLSFLRTPVGAALAFIPAMALTIFMIQNLLDLNESNTLALKQILYYVFFLFSSSALTVIVIKYANYAFSIICLLIVASISVFISINLSPTWIYGPNVIRGNLENTTAYILVLFIVFHASSYKRLIFLSISYLIFSVFTDSGQGVLLSTFFLLFLALPTLGLKRLMVASVTTLPFLLPAIALLASDSVAQIDQNVDFRRIVWRQIYEDFFNGNLVVGRLGSVINKDFIDLLMRSGAAWEGAENIGAHNFPLQLTQLFGVSGLIASIIFLVALVRMTLPLVNYPGIVFCFLALMVSLTLNQADAHLLHQFGTALLVACIAAAYLSSEATTSSGHANLQLTRRMIDGRQR